MILLPSDPLQPRRVDPHFRPDASVARDRDVPVGLVDHDALVRGEVRLTRTVTGPAVYRGWMVTSAAYGRLHRGCAEKGVQLLTSPLRYRRAHELPGWVVAVPDLVATTVVMEADRPPGREQLAALLHRLPPGPVLVKDFVKAVKHDSGRASRIEDPADLDDAAEVVRRLFAVRGSDLVGGLVVRSWEPWTGPEIRTWWVRYELVAVTPHPDEPYVDVPALPTPLLDRLAEAVDELGLLFCSADVRRHEDGRWRLVEIGDGGVSDCPEGGVARVIGALLDAL